MFKKKQKEEKWTAEKNPFRVEVNGGAIVLTALDVSPQDLSERDQQRVRDVTATPPIKGWKMKAYTTAKTYPIGFVSAMGTSAVLSTGVVQHTLNSVPHQWLAQKVAGINIMSGWVGSYLGKFAGFSGLKDKKLEKAEEKYLDHVNEYKDKLGKVAGGVGNLGNVVLKTAGLRTHHFPTLELYDAQGQVLTGGQVAGSLLNTALRAGLWTAGLFVIGHEAAHYFLAHPITSIPPRIHLAGEMRLVPIHSVVHLSPIQQFLHNTKIQSTVTNFLNKSGFGYFDKALAFAGMFAVKMPTSLVAMYIRRRIACQVIDQERVVGVKRKIRKMGFGKVYGQLYKGAIQGEYEHRLKLLKNEYEQRESDPSHHINRRPWITKASELTPEKKAEARDIVFGLSGRALKAAQREAAGLS